MKTFLQIITDAWEEAGLTSSGPASVSIATGIQKRMVGWVRQAWIDIQQYRNDWPWMVRTFSFHTSPGKRSYTLLELNLTNVERWKLQGVSAYRASQGQAAEFFLSPTTHEDWWMSARLGVQNSSIPALIFTNPFDNSLTLHPIPDDDFVVTVRYHAAPQVLAVDGDIPLIPTNTAWQEIIKWKALMYYAFHDGAPSLYDEAEDNYSKMIHALDNRYGNNIRIVGSPIA